MSFTAPHTGSSQAATAPLPNAWRVEIFRKEGVDDPEGVHAQAALLELGVEGIERVRLGRGYLLPESLDRAAVERITGELLRDPVVDSVRVTEPGKEPETAAGAQRVIVAKKPGVMDAVATTLDAALDRMDPPVGLEPGQSTRVATFHAWEIFGADASQLGDAVRTALANEVIEDIGVGSEALHFGAPSARTDHGRVEVPIIGLDHDALLKLSAEGALSLNLTEMLEVQKHYADEGREPSLCELETIAQTWSEHCQHKTFRGIIEMGGETIDSHASSSADS